MSLYHKRDWTNPTVSGWLGAFIGPGRNTTALRLVPVYASVALIADMFSSLPLDVFTKSGGERREVDAPAWLRSPDPRISEFEWRYQYTVSMKLRGNAYGLVVGSLLDPVGLVWLNPDKVTVDETNPERPVYRVGSAQYEQFSQGGRIVHVREFLQPGTVKGLSPIENFARDFEVGNAAREFGARFFRSSEAPTSLLSAKTRLKEGDATKARDAFRDAVSEGGPVVLDLEWDYKRLAVSPQEAQFLETIKANATTIATIFRVQPEDVGGEVANSRTYANREADAERFNVRTMLPHVTKFEQALNPLLRAQSFVRLNMDVLARPNLLERIRANSEALRTGQIFHDEMRRLEDRPPATAEQIAFWQENYQTFKSEAESVSVSTTEVGA